MDDNKVSVQIKKTALVFDKISNQLLAPYGLSGSQFKILMVLYHAPMGSVRQIDIETKSGKAPLDAVVSATVSRIVPVAMASGTTILGMLPLLFDAMFGGMAATIMGGLLVASALTLFVLPVAYCAIHRIKGDLPAQNGMTDNENK